MKAVILLSLTLLLSGTCFGKAAAGAKDQRGVHIGPSAQENITLTGKYWALLIGIDDYQYFPNLQTPVHDVKTLRNVLISRYAFSSDKILMLTNRDATREAIENTLFRVTKEVGPEDSLLIYYAGHGQMDPQARLGFWIPFDGKQQSPGTYVSNAVIRDVIAAMRAKHVYLVADSCFSGTLFASRSGPAVTDKFFKRLYNTKSRWGLTSGMNEPVTDDGIDGHSVFAYFFLKALRDNNNAYLVPSHIYHEIAPKIGRNAYQQPRSQPLYGTGDEGGQFVFVLSPGATENEKDGFGISSDPNPIAEHRDPMLEARLHSYQTPDYLDSSADKRPEPKRTGISATYKMTLNSVKRNEELPLYSGFYSFMNPPTSYLEETEYRLIFSANGHFEEQVYSRKVYGPYLRNGMGEEAPQLKGTASGTYRLAGKTGELQYTDHIVKFSIPANTLSFPPEYIHIGGGPWQLVQ